MTNQKQKFIRYLLIFVVVLLITDIVIDRLQKPKSPPKQILGELSVARIDSTFFSVLDEYGIERNWISKKKVKPADDDSTTNQYFVKIPADVPIPLVLRDINKIIEKDITGLVSEEKKIYGATEIRVYANEILKLKATLIPDKGIIRNGNSVAFIISDALDLGENDFNQFLSITQPLACTVVPAKSIVPQVDTLKNYRKEYIVLLDDEIKESELKLKQEFQKELLRGSIKNIISLFREAKAYTIDEKSKIFISPIYNFVRDDFKRQGITLYPYSEFIHLNAADDSELTSKFRYYSNDTTGVRQKIFICSFENFQKILPELEQYKKKGHKIIPVSKSYLTRKPD